MNKDLVIIGGGVAGLCAAIELCKKGINPILIEAGSYPAHKTCGEFLSPACLPWLEKLNIFPISIEETDLYLGNQTLSFKLPTRAGSLSHYTLDTLLAEKAVAMGTKILTQVKVQSFQAKLTSAGRHQIELSTGEILHAHAVIVAVGRMPSLSSPSQHFKYMGIKAHFDGIDLNHSLKMFSFQNAYLGLSPIEGGRANLACLSSMQRLQQSGSVECLMQELITSNPHLNAILAQGKRLFSAWMTAPIPFFGFKPTPHWSDAYFIGDSAISVPPACGGGLALAIMGGIQAAHHASLGDFYGFKKKFKASNISLMCTAKALHYLFMHPRLGKGGLHICSLYPSLPQKLFLASRPNFSC